MDSKSGFKIFDNIKSKCYVYHVFFSMSRKSWKKLVTQEVPLFISPQPEQETVSWDMRGRFWHLNCLIINGRIGHEFVLPCLLIESVLRIHDILVWIRIRIRVRGSMPLTNGSGFGSWCEPGSFYFNHWPSRCQQKTNLKRVFLHNIFLKVLYIIFQR